jgi:sporulation protein YlmC with PRC-barrel domain
MLHLCLHREREASEIAAFPAAFHRDVQAIRGFPRCNAAIFPDKRPLSNRCRIGISVRTARPIAFLLSRTPTHRRDNMKKLTTIAAAAALALTFAAPVLAQTAGGMVSTTHEMRTSKMVGSPVYNESGDKIGAIFDIIVRAGATEPTAIVTVGEYTGGGSRLVAFPLSKVKVEANKMMISGASRDALLNMPAYVFGQQWGSG